MVEGWEWRVEGGGCTSRMMRRPTSPTVLESVPHRNESINACRGGLVFKAHRLLYRSTLGLRVIKKKEVLSVYPPVGPPQGPMHCPTVQGGVLARFLVGPYSINMPGALWRSYGGGQVLESVPHSNESINACSSIESL